MLFLIVAGAVHVSVLLVVHGAGQQVPGPGGVRVRRHRVQDITGGERCHIHVSKNVFFS